MTKILILAANPQNTSKLRLDEEVREIQVGLERAKKRDQFEIVSRWAVRPEDWRRSLLDYEPRIVHFMGHGAGVAGIISTDESGLSKPVSTEALAGLFELFEGTVQCVLLNACYSAVQADAICQHVDYVIGMSQGIGDRAAIQFAIGFYDALGAGRSIEDAYKFGCNAIALASITEFLTPILKIRQSLSSFLLKGDLVARSALPTQVATLEQPEGKVPLDSPFYIERPPIESDCYEAIINPGALIRVKAPRQMGKTSLMSRILCHAAQPLYGCNPVFLSLQEADGSTLTDLDQLLYWFCSRIADELKLPDQLADFWKGARASKDRCSNYFRKYLLTKIEAPLVLGLDEVDQIFEHPEVAKEFFGLLRAWHERGKDEAIWQKLRLVLVHSKEVYIPLNINQSPFNVGLAVELLEFSLFQVQRLIQLHGLVFSTTEIEQLMAMVGGHPYLVRVALYQLARRRMTLPQLLKVAPTEEGLYSDHLRRHLLNLEENQDLLSAIKAIVLADKPMQIIKIGSTQTFKLRSMGLVKLQENTVMPFCDLYRLYFGDRLISL